MKYAYNRFVKLVEETENVYAIYRFLTQKEKVPLDISDLLRWQWVQYVSALDKVVHDLVRIGMIDIFEGRRQRTDKYNTFQIDIQTYQNIHDGRVDASIAFENIIIQKHNFLAFQAPSKISDALAYISKEPDKWKRISGLMGMSKEQCTTYLKNVVIRRNQIVHEGDYTDILSRRQDIFEQDVLDIKEFILKLGKAIYDVAK